MRIVAGGTTGPGRPQIAIYFISTLCIQSTYLRIDANFKFRLATVGCTFICDTLAVRILFENGRPKTLPVFTLVESLMNSLMYLWCLAESRHIIFENRSPQFERYS